MGQTGVFWWEHTGKTFILETILRTNWRKGKRDDLMSDRKTDKNRIDKETKKLTDRNTEWLISERLVDELFDIDSGRLIKQLNDRLTDWLIDWLIEWLINWLIGWLIGWLIDWLIDWLFTANQNSHLADSKTPVHQVYLRWSILLFTYWKWTWNNSTLPCYQRVHSRKMVETCTQRSTSKWLEWSRTLRAKIFSWRRE